MEERDQRRWTLADEDKDGALTILEFKHFLHPEEADHMRDIVVQETLEDIDKVGKKTKEDIMTKSVKCIINKLNDLEEKQRFA